MNRFRVNRGEPGYKTHGFPLQPAQLPAKEQEVCQKLWDDVGALLEKAGDGK
jgi:hypothetical protein